jgi:uncharacterized protein with HEPN domain
MMRLHSISITAAQRIVLFATGLTKTNLATDEEKQSAILYQVIVVGEATKRLSASYSTRPEAARG